MHTHEKWMSRCLQLASYGLGHVAANPLVGCVVVYNEKILGESYHKKYGEAHAEVNAIEVCTDYSLLPDSTLYVNLEPCSHQGKTPPCVDLIIKHGIRKVVVGMSDPNPLVNGRGIEILQSQGVEVTVGILKKNCELLNRRFITAVTKKRPYITLKWAQTNNGYFAPADRSQRWISNYMCKQLLHRWRSEEQAVLVGARTAVNDNASLNVRNVKGTNPIRVVLANQPYLAENLNVLSGEIDTIIFNHIHDEKKNNCEWIKIEPYQELHQMLHILHARNIYSILVEGGRETLDKFIKANLWDEAKVIQADVNWEDGIRAPVLNGLLVATHPIGDDKIFEYKNQNIA